VQAGRLRTVTRPDVAAHFGRPSLLHSGFRGLLYLPSLRGPYRMGLAYHRGGRWHRMPGSQRSIDFAPPE